MWGKPKHQTLTDFGVLLYCLYMKKSATQLNISLTSTLAKMVRGRVDSGMYNSASEVVRDSLRLLAEKEMLKEMKRKELRKLIKEGDDAIKAGRVSEWNKEEILKEARAITKEV